MGISKRSGYPKLVYRHQSEGTKGQRQKISPFKPACKQCVSHFDDLEKREDRSRRGKILTRGAPFLRRMMMSYPKTCNGMRQAIAEFLKDGGSEAHKFWDIITALRGPDSPSERPDMTPKEASEAYAGR